MLKKYRITSGKRELKIVSGYSPYDALSDVMIRYGAQRDDFITVGPNQVSWRGAIFKAEEVEPTTLLPS